MHPYKYIPNRLLSPIRFTIRKIANFLLPLYFRHSDDYNSSQIQSNVIVSLTSFPDRINKIYLTIKSLKRQSYRPKMILLYLSNEQFISKESLPIDLLELEDDFFSIILVDGDIRSHKKYYYAMNEFKNSCIVTVDDDVIYHPDILKSLIITSEQYPYCIIANQTIKLNYKDEQLLPYTQWSHDIIAFEDHDLVQVGVGGVLYPSNCLSDVVFDVKLFTKLAFMADDLWLNAMARLNNTPIIQSAWKHQVLPILSDAPELNKSNVTGGANDIQLQNIRKYFLKENKIDLYSSDY